MNNGKLLLSVQDADLAFSGIPLFEGMTFHIKEGDKICLVGKNGAGKTTLMNIISGKQPIDTGEFWKFPGTTVGYLQQDIKPSPEQTVFDFVFEEVKPDKGQTIEEADAMKAYKVDIVLAPLDLAPQDRMDRLSGGQLRRAAVARALVEDPDILLMDEPTNHLDLDIIEWLENYLRHWQGALICISHDKAFLSTISDQVFWLDRGRLRVCPYGFSRFEEWQEQMLDQEMRTLHNREKILKQELEWANRGVKARRKRNIRRLEQMKEERDKLKRDQSSFRRVMSKIELPEAEIDELSSKVVMEFKSVCKSFKDGDKETLILDKFNLRILRGDRIGILGKNGSGKTTFLKLLIGELQPDSGTIKLKKDIGFSYFDQKRKDLDPNKTLWETMCPGGGDYVNVRGKNRHVIGYLKDFLFEPDKVDQKVKTLSGGQKNRLMLARVLANPQSLLILDEPTNDLDMETLDMLEEILNQYEGTLLVVSHDRDFLDQTVTKILAFDGNGAVEGYIGGYSDYIEKRNKNKHEERKLKEKNEDKKPAPQPKKQPPAKPEKLTYKLEYELKRLPRKIEEYETEIQELEEILADPDFYNRDPSDFQVKTKRLVEAREALDIAETRWLELSEMKEKALQ